MIRTSPLRIFFVFLMPLSLWAQAPASSSSSPKGPTPYGNGEQPTLSYAGETLPRNLLYLSLDSETIYDDNVLNTNKLRKGDVGFGLGPRLATLHRRKHLDFGFDYHPYFMLYHRTPQYNRLDQSLGLDLNYRYSPRLGLRLRDSFSYQTGIYQPRSSEEFIPGLGSPTSLNGSVFTPLARERMNQARLDVIYQKSGRTTFMLFGDLEQRQFKGQAAGGGNLYDTQGRMGGLDSVYRLTAHTSLGALYLFQRMTFGETSRTIAHSVLPSFAWQVSPGVALEFFGGPQYARVRDRLRLVIPLGPGVDLIFTQNLFRTEWHGAGGGSLSKRSDKTAFQISAQRIVTDGGGLLTSVTNSTVNVELRRRLMRRWEAVWGLSATRLDALGARFAHSRLSNQTASFALEHSLARSLRARLAYNAIRQRHSGPALLFADFDANRVSFGLYYQLKKIPLGR
jgi:hypothetical protein